MAKKFNPNKILCGNCWRELKPNQAKCGHCGFAHDLSLPPMETGK